MCGIFGVIGSDNASLDVYHGLITLQHRGQDAAGILSMKNGRFRMNKGVGLVTQIFDEDSILDLDGEMAIGHVRYPTVGAGSQVDAQPFMTEFSGGIGLAHNGNLSNFETLRETLTHEGWYINSDCDAELLLKAFASGIKNRPLNVDSYFRAVASLFYEVAPSYSAITLVGGGLLAFRDPKGIRPLVYGEKDDNGKKGYAFSSESVALASMDYENIQDVKPGEVIFVDKDRKVHKKTIVEKKHQHCMFEWIYFGRAESEWEGRHLYLVRENLGRELAKQLDGIKGDIVIAVPDTSRTAAIALAEEMKLPNREGFIKNRYIGRSFIMNSQKKRENAVKLKLNPVHPNIKDKRVIVVDDSIVRGTTSKHIVSLLRKTGAKEVHLVSACPPIQKPCFWGVDFPLSEELIAGKGGDEETHEESVERIRKEIGADTLTYISLDGLFNAIDLPDLCTACLGGDTPTCTQDMMCWQKKRKEDREKKADGLSEVIEAPSTETKTAPEKSLE